MPSTLMLERVEYFTFLPDFLPEALLTLLRPLEAWLEASFLRGLSAHYVACFRKAPEPGRTNTITTDGLSPRAGE